MRVSNSGGENIPSTGLSSPAILESEFPEPYTIDVNMQLTLVIGEQEKQIKFPNTTKVKMTALEVVKTIISQAFFPIRSENKRIVLVDPSRVSIRGGEALGFRKVKAAKARRLYPSWGMRTKRELRFSAPIPQEKYTIQYITDSRYCPRCRGTLFENDFRLDFGSPKIIVDENLLYQQLQKLLLTRLGSNPYHAWYGTSIPSRIGNKTSNLTATQLKEEVRRALTNFQTVQREQAKYQALSLKEQLYRVVRVDAFPHKEDPTLYYVEVEVMNASTERIKIDTFVKIGGV